MRDIVDHDELEEMDDLPDLDDDEKSKKKKVSGETEKSKLGKVSIYYQLKDKVCQLRIIIVLFVFASFSGFQDSYTSNYYRQLQ